MRRTFLILSAAGWMLTGCATSIGLGGLPPIPESKLQPCRPPAVLRSGSHNAIEAWATAAGFAYRDCADAQAELAETIRLRQRIEAGDD